HPVIEPEGPAGGEIVAGLRPGAPALDSALDGVGSRPLRDVGELLSQVVAEIDVAVHRDFPGRDGMAGLKAPAVHVAALDRGAVQVLVVLVEDHVPAPARFAEFLGEVEPGFELRYAGGLAAPDAVVKI